MKLIVFGASGQLGTRIVTEALDRGHDVTGVARDAARVDERGGRVTAAAADATDPKAIAAVAPGHEVALSAVTQHDRPDVLVEVARALLAGLGEAGVPRVVVAGGAGSLTVPSGGRLLDTPDFRDEWKPEALAQAAALEAYETADTDVDWSYISPGALLAPGERTGSYRVGGDELLVDEHGRSGISMEDFAIAMVDEAEQARHLRRRFTAAH